MNNSSPHSDKKSWKQAPMFRQTLNSRLRILVNMLMNIEIIVISICWTQAGEERGCVCRFDLFDKPLHRWNAHWIDGLDAPNEAGLVEMAVVRRRWCVICCDDVCTGV